MQQHGIAKKRSRSSKSIPLGVFGDKLDIGPDEINADFLQGWQIIQICSFDGVDGVTDLDLITKSPFAYGCQTANVVLVGHFDQVESVFGNSGRLVCVDIFQELVQGIRIGVLDFDFLGLKSQKASN